MRSVCLFPILSLALAALGPVRAEVRSTFVPESSLVRQRHKKKQELRGGGNPIGGNGLAQFATVLAGAGATYLTLAPSKALATYGFESTPLLEYMMEWLGHIGVSHTIAAWCIHFKKTSINTAIGSGTLWLLVSTVKSLLNGLPEKFGFSEVGQYIFLAVNAFCGLSLLKNAEYSDKVLVAYPWWGMLNGLFFWLSPAKIGNAWGVAGNDAVLSLFRSIGCSMVAKSTYFLLLVRGTEASEALGYGLIPSLAGLLGNMFVTKDFATLNLPMGPFYAWVVMLAGLIAGLLF